MALIKCPECGGQVSDQAQSCPHCGYILQHSNSQTDGNAPEPTQIEGYDKTGSSIQTVVGSVVIVGGVGLLFLFWPIALLVIAVGAWLLNEGGKAYAPKVKVECPYCKKSGMMDRKQTIYGCPNCKKQSVREDDHLYPML